MTDKQQLAAALARVATVELENTYLRAGLVAAIVREQMCEDAVNRPIINVPASSASTELASSSRPASSGDVR